MRINHVAVGARHTLEGPGQALANEPARVDSEGQKNLRSPARGSNPGSSDLNI